MPAVPKAVAWAMTPSKNTHLVFLREDIASTTVLDNFEQIVRDHGFDVVKREGNKLTARLTGGRTKMELTAITGRHEIKGNTLAIEYDTYTVEKALKIAGIVLVAVVVVAAVVAIAVVAKEGGGGHNHHHCGGGGGSSFFWYGPTYIHTPRRTVTRTNYVYGGWGAATTVPQAQSYESRDQFFPKFFENVDSCVRTSDPLMYRGQ